MVSGRALSRMREAHPEQFEPKAIVFSTSPIAERNEWVNCFYLKASAVYACITGRDDREGGTAYVAPKLLLCIAERCASLKAEEKGGPKPAITQTGDARAPKPLVSIHSTDEATATATATATEEWLANLSEETKLFIDAIYLIVGFLADLNNCLGKNWHREKADDHYISARRHEMISDVIKIENQLPLHDVIMVVKHVQAAIKGAKDSLVREKVIEAIDPLYSSIESFQLGFTIETFHEVIHLFCWYYSPFYLEKTKSREEVLQRELSRKENLLECLYSYLVMGLSRHAGREEVATVFVGPTTTARQLVKSGLKFEPTDDGIAGIKLSDPIFHVPAVIFDFKVETIVRNLLAWERVYEEEKPVTRYFQLMNELVDEASDVGVLRRFGILRWKWWKEAEVVDFIERINGFVTYPSICPAMDREIGKVNDFHNKKSKKFLARNKPAVVWVSSAAVVSILLTAIFAAKRGG